MDEEHSWQTCLYLRGASRLCVGVTSGVLISLCSSPVSTNEFTRSVTSLTGTPFLKGLTSFFAFDKKSETEQFADWYDYMQGLTPTERQSIPLDQVSFMAEHGGWAGGAHGQDKIGRIIKRQGYRNQ